MPNLNRVFLMGNLTRDPELRYTPNGAAVANLRIAINRRFKDQSGETKEETCFVTVVVWGKQAEACSQYLNKGRPVFVDGRLRSRSWESQDGQKRNTMEVVAFRVQFLGGGPKTDEPRAPLSREGEATINLGEEMDAAARNESEDAVPF